MFNRSVFKLISLFSLLLLPSQGFSQVAYHNFNSNDGLPSNEVYCAYQDRDGFLWFGTDHGIVKYNGYNFKTYTTADGLTDNTVLDIREDDNSRLWFLTYAGGLCYYDGGRFFPHPNNDTITRICSMGLPKSWEVLKNNQVWMAFRDIGF
jgi:ligand-binding sensor domain-containing protein